MLTSRSNMLQPLFAPRILLPLSSLSTRTFVRSSINPPSSLSILRPSFYPSASSLYMRPLRSSRAFNGSSFNFCLSFYPSFHPFILLFVLLSDNPSIRPSIRPSILSSFHPSFYPSFYHVILLFVLPVFHPAIRPSIL